jgi:hypothetical protein
VSQQEPFREIDWSEWNRLFKWIAKGIIEGCTRGYSSPYSYIRGKRIIAVEGLIHHFLNIGKHKLQSAWLKCVCFWTWIFEPL